MSPTFLGGGCEW